MFAGLRPRRQAGLLVALAGVLSLAACSLPGVNATPDAATILKGVQGVKISDATFTFSYNGKLSAQASSFLLSNVGVDASGTLSGNGNGEITASPQRAQLAFILPFQIAGITPSLELLSDGATKTLYAGSNVLTLVSSATNGKSWFEVPISQFGGFDITPVLNFSQLLNVSLAGSETLNGVSVYHLKGTESGTVSAAIDLYVRQDNYNPVRAVINLTTLIVGSVTLDFAGINTGVTVTPPTSDQIINA